MSGAVAFAWQTVPMTRSGAVGLIVETLLVVLGAATVFGGDTTIAFYSVIAWPLLALVYVAVVLGAAWRRRTVPDDDGTRKPALRLSRWMIVLLGLTPATAAFMGVLGALLELSLQEGPMTNLPTIVGTEREEALALVRMVIKLTTVLMAILGWSLLHLSYARHYERLNRIHGPAFAFPGTKDPELTDYVYFAMTIGTTFATSDVNVTSRRLRWTVTVHSVLAFFYNAIVMAIAFKLITD
ncbi:Protein of unknown function [Actinomyces denticolens]|uniref:DUF1345 domain-containing protein n=2 Tax=Actinomyces denticolens TaxID=52767 RepID=A0ABY1IG35_9ACTO|nr:Protein of unknown function [Actinomyces denticolens]